MKKPHVVLGLSFFCLSLCVQAESQTADTPLLLPRNKPLEALNPIASEAMVNETVQPQPAQPVSASQEPGGEIAYPLSITPTGEDVIYTQDEAEAATFAEMSAEEFEQMDEEAEENTGEEAGPIPLSIELVEENVLAKPNEGPYPVEITPEEESAAELPYETFSDLPMLRNITVPDWFKNTFLDLPEDLKSAVAAGKQGLIVYFGQRHCAYCEAMQQTVFSRPDLKAYIDRYFDVVAIDVWGKLDVTTMQGESRNETQFANDESTYFTPSLLFYNAQGKETLRLRGYYPPHVIRSALDYVVSNSYRTESFRDYQTRGKPSENPEHAQQLHSSPLFMQPPYLLDRQMRPAQRPLVVIFEQPRCQACNIFHTDLMSDPVIQKRLQEFDIVQLDLLKDTPVLTPTGQKTTAKQWAGQAGIFYTPSLLFFNQQGQEIFRVESVIHHIRLNQVLKYVLQGGYKETPIFERWISHQLTVEDEASGG